MKPLKAFVRKSKAPKRLVTCIKTHAIRSFHSTLVEKYQIGVRFLGNLDYLPEDVREIANKVTERTKHQTK